MDELRDAVQYEFKRISGLKLQAQMPISGILQQVENSLKVDVMMISTLRRNVTEYFQNIHEEFKSEISSKLTTKEMEVKNQLDNALMNLDRLREDMKKEEEMLVLEIQGKLENKYKEREQSLIDKLKARRQEDMARLETDYKRKEEQMKQNLMSTIDNVDRLRKELTKSGQELEDGIRMEMLEQNKKREKDLIENLEKDMKDKISAMEEKFKGQIDILENELQRAQKKIKELRESNK